MPHNLDAGPKIPPLHDLMLFPARGGHSLPEKGACDAAKGSPRIKTRADRMVTLHSAGGILHERFECVHPFAAL